MNGDFAPDWLRLREPHDSAARSRALGRRFGSAVRARAGTGVAQLVDLGAGTGANFRALAPLVPGDQDWRLIDRDPALLALQPAEIAQWARGQGYPAAHGSDAVTVTGGAGVWRAHGAAADLARDLAQLPLARAHGVVCAAFLDLVSAAWLQDLIEGLTAARLPFLAALTVDGRREWRPSHPDDAALDDAFRRHQRTDKGFGPALGPDAPGEAIAGFEAAGYRVSAAPSDWRLAASAEALLDALVDGAAAAGAASAPDAAGIFARWREFRLNERSRRALVVGHVDILALPVESS
jgi:hypothetical protein